MFWTYLEEGKHDEDNNEETMSLTREPYPMVNINSEEIP